MTKSTCRVGSRYSMFQQHITCILSPPVLQVAVPFLATSLVCEVSSVFFLAGKLQELSGGHIQCCTATFEGIHCFKSRSVWHCLSQHTRLPSPWMLMCRHWYKLDCSHDHSASGAGHPGHFPHPPSGRDCLHSCHLVNSI